MTKFEELSISDTKVLLDFVNSLKNERATDLKRDNVKLIDDIQYSDLDKLAFDLHRKMFGTVWKLIKDHKNGN
jgi:hypothetical protein